VRVVSLAVAAVLWSAVSEARSAEVVVVEREPYGEWARFSLIYSPEIALANSSLPAPNSTRGMESGTTFQNIGFEMSTVRGPFGRYHAQLAYTNVNGVSGIRLDPLGIGWAVPLAWGHRWVVELEPILSLIDGVLLFTNDPAGNANVTFYMSSGAELQLNVVSNNFYAYVAPIGIELRYLEITSGPGGNVYGAGDPFWRFRLGLGVQY
jgi:hypothetical protein